MGFIPKVLTFWPQNHVLRVLLRTQQECQLEYRLQQEGNKMDRHHGGCRSLWSCPAPALTLGWALVPVLRTHCVLHHSSHQHLCSPSSCSPQYKAMENCCFFMGGHSREYPCGGLCCCAENKYLAPTISRWLNTKTRPKIYVYNWSLVMESSFHVPVKKKKSKLGSPLLKTFYSISRSSEIPTCNFYSALLNDRLLLIIS